jgi:DNA-binding MarR family transcriptional regulator
LLIRCSQIWGDLAIAAVNLEAGAPVLREAHTRLLPHLQNPAGIRITDLALAVGVSKQAVQPLVAELATIGLVRIATDTEDARARRVFLTPFGLQALQHGTGILLQIEEQLAPRLGERTRASLRKQLAKLLAVLSDAGGSDEPGDSGPHHKQPRQRRRPRAAP